MLYNTEKALGKQKPFQESREKRKSFHIREGEEVLLEKKKKGGHTCVESGWTAPFLVRNIAEESGRIQKATVSRLKPYFTCERELDAGTKNGESELGSSFIKILCI